MTGRHRVTVAVIALAACCACLAPPARGAERTQETRRACSVAAPHGAGQDAPASVLTGQDLGGTLAAGFEPDGAAFVRATVGDLEVTNTVAPTGAFTISLVRGEDTVLIRVGLETVAVTRGTDTIEAGLASAAEEQWLAVQSLLAGSRSVRAMRVLGARIAPRAERSPGGLALILTDAVVGFVDGDVSALHRLAERFGRKPAAVRLARDGPGCYEKWEAEVLRAWDDYLDCMSLYPQYEFWRDGCSLRWMLWAESAWFAFLKCAGSPFIAQ